MAVVRGCQTAREAAHTQLAPCSSTRSRQNARMLPSVAHSWDQITAWLRSHTPVSAAHLGPPAAEHDIAAVAALLGRPLPADLVEW
jgi:hypothetical protein